MKRRRRSTKRKAPENATNQATKWLQGEEGLFQAPDNVNLGKDIIFEILARFPIKFLLRFKTVSKCWYRLISSSEFINVHLKYACDDPNHTHHKLLHIDVNSEEILQQTPVMDHENGSLETGITHPIEFWREELRHDSALAFVGSCKGLVCIAGLYHRVVIWNPALRKCKRLPYFGRGSKVVYGFGYDETRDDFKVVGIRNSSERLVNGLIKIYSARTNCWKKLEEDGFRAWADFVDDHGCFLNGKLHWATQNRLTGNKSIFTVDLSSERFGVIELPDCLRMVKFRAWSVHAVGEILFVFVFYRKKSPASRCATADLWMMERYGVKESWTRVNCDFTNSRCAPLEYTTKEGMHRHAHFMNRR